MSIEVNIDALLPQEMAQKAESAGARKAALPFPALFALSILASSIRLPICISSLSA